MTQSGTVGEAREVCCVLSDAADRYLSNPVYADMPEPDFSDPVDALE